MAALAGASPASEPPDSSLPPPLAAYSPSHQSIPVTNSPSSSDLDLNNNDIVHQFPDLVKKPSFSTNQSSSPVRLAQKLMPLFTPLNMCESVLMLLSLPQFRYAAAVRASLPLESPTSSGRAKVNI
ncbi:unnamed protein product [Brassica oleracea]